MKTYNQFIFEAENTLKMTRLYHGTDSSAAQNIKKTGFKTDVNVTRQMRGAGVYTTPSKETANTYAKDRAGKRGTSPSRLEVLTPSKVLKGKGQNLEKGDLKFKAYGMQPAYANKNLVKNTNQIRVQNPSFPHSSPTEVKNRFRSNLADTNSKRSSGIPTKPGVVGSTITTKIIPPKGTTVTMGKAKLRPTNTSRGGRGGRGGGMSGSQRNAGDATPRDDGRIKDYQIGGGERYGIAGIGLADSYDLYDLILSHLLDEGYAETPEAAEAIMVNMSEEWRDDIFEGRVPWNDPKNPNPSGYTPKEKSEAKRKQLGVDNPNTSSFEKGGPGEKEYARHGNLAAAQKKMSKRSQQPKGKPHEFRKNPFWKKDVGQVRREIMGTEVPKDKKDSYPSKN